MKLPSKHLGRSQTILLALIFLIDLAQACGPGRAGGRRHPSRYRKFTPLVQRQYFPNTGENTLGASGRPEGAIRRHDKRFKELVQNWNPDIEFRDDERTGADRMMSQRLKEKLSVLAISVMNQWPNVKLRVIEGWDEDYRHSVNSLHYEGRAVDITTSDKDKSKYGMLARLAVEAGFDWVHYESRSHVHCSVRSEKADVVRNDGCFDAKSLVETPMGQMEMSQLQTNDLVLAMNSAGELTFSPVLMWLDRDELNSELFVELSTESGRTVRLTSSHLIYVTDEPPAPHTETTTTSTPVPGLDDLNANKSQQTLSNRPPPPGTGDDVRRGGNNYYYYDIGGGSSDGNGTPKQLVNTIGQAEWQVSGSNGSAAHEITGDQTIPRNGTSFELADYVYTTYARNALVGQYLLVNSPAEEQFEFEPNQGDHGSGFGRKSSSAQGRLSFAGQNELGGQGTNSKRGWNNYIPSRRRAQSLERLKTTKARVRFDQIVSVNFVTRQGIYAPLTREGNIVVNSVVASCYAVISDHNMAHLSMAPVRWLNYLKEILFGLRPETPAYERTIDFFKRREMYEAREVRNQQANLGSAITTDNSPNATRESPNHQTTNSLNRTTHKTRHIHWYPILLYNIARFVLPTAYLY